MTNSIFQKLAATSAVCFLASAAQAAPVNLSTWSAEGSGSWSVAADQNSVFQNVNTANGTVFHSGVDSQGTKLSGTITVEENGGDDDFIGFVLGFQSGEIAGAAAEYILIDWKQRTQPFYSACDNSIDGIAGLSISRVSGPLAVQDAWCHNGGVTELARATTLGSTGWNDNQTYEFDLEFTATNIKVFVDGAKELDIDGTFSDGAFGFYNFSQPSVRYAGLTEDVLPPTGDVPLPAGLPLMMAGLGALGWMKRRKA